ncbi:hypothetical protein C7S17_0635 [Burkholderia thailandensis]|nr:hypothetical protein [Burkholderia thailandensis]
MVREARRCAQMGRGVTQASGNKNKKADRLAVICLATP